MRSFNGAACHLDAVDNVVAKNRILHAGQVDGSAAPAIPAVMENIIFNQLV